MTDHKDRVAGWATDIDWSKAPEGATHYLPADTKRSWYACWYKKDSLGQWLGLNASNHARGACDEWTVDNDQVEAFTEALIPRPAQPWSGDGLPPVGTRCELHISGDNWQPCEVIAMDEQDGQPVSVVRYGGGYYGADLSCLRPIKTPAQIAAEEREAAIDDLTAGFSNDTLRSWAIRAYDDLGYRKQEKPE